MAADPDRIGRYRIDGVLGRGAMGVIYRAHDPDIDRVVAIKLILADLLDGSDRDDYLARFRREAQAAGRCMHPNIVTIHDFAMHDGNPFLAMEFVDGITLAKAMRHTPVFDPADAVFVILQILAALEAAHATGIVHRDIKPANVLLVGGTHVKVTDFGISRIENAMTHSGAVIGTPSYMSPEQARGDAVDLRSDLFSTGVILFEMLAGRKPFPGTGFAEMWNALTHADPVDPAALASIARPLQDVVLRCLSKPVADRFATAAAQASALRHAMTAIGASLADRTIVAPPYGRPANTMPTMNLPEPTLFNPQAIRAIEDKLTALIGPIARQLVRTAIRRNGDLPGVCAALAASIDRPDDRRAFERQASVLIGQTQSGLSKPSDRNMTQAGLVVHPDELARIEAALANHVGPIARILIKRGLAASPTHHDFLHGLSRHIDRQDDRDAFLAALG